MSIEFYCQECYQKVVTPDSTAGKKGRCPYCSKVVSIPLQSETQAPTQPAAPIGLNDLIGPGGTPGVDPSKQAPGAAVVGGQDDGWRETQKLAKWGEFAHESRFKRIEEQREVVRRTLALPSVGLIVASAFGMLFNAIYVLVIALSVAQVMVTDVLRPDTLVMNLFFVVCNIAIHTLIIIGANHMRMTRSYTTAIAGAILAIIPIPLNLVCPISAPFGIWALALLARKENRMVFKRT